MKAIYCGFVRTLPYEGKFVIIKYSFSGGKIIAIRKGRLKINKDGWAYTYDRGKSGLQYNGAWKIDTGKEIYPEILSVELMPIENRL